MQLPLHSCWPETVQLQVPLTQEAPAPQALPQVPQSAAFAGPLHVPSEHFVPEVQVDEQVPVLSQTSPLAHAVQLVPQWSGLDWTQAPPQLTKPPVQTHEPEVQVLPAPADLAARPTVLVVILQVDADRAALHLAGATGTSRSSGSAAHRRRARRQ